MSVPKNNAADVSDREIVITRLLRAPRELVFAAFTDPKHIGEWWGPNGFTNTIYERDVRPGGAWRYMMHGPDGVNYPNKIVYLEIIKPERLVYEHGIDVPDLKSDPDRFHVTVTFEDQAGKTLVTLRTLFASAERCEAVKQFGAVEGGHQTLGRLDAYLSGNDPAKSEVITLRVTRRFNASAEQVFDAWLDPTNVGRWLFATPNGKMIRVEIDARVGGRFVIVERRGSIDALHCGEYSVIERPRRLAFRFAVNEQLTDAAQVQVDIRALARGCELSLTQTLPPAFAEYAERTRQGWAMILASLDSLLH